MNLIRLFYFRSSIFSLCIACMLIFGSCATGYTYIRPSKIDYGNTNTSSDEAVSFYYQYDVLRKRYRKKEMNSGLRVVAVKITNNSNRDLVIGRDIEVTGPNGSALYLFDNQHIFKTLRQQTASHLLYMLLSPLTLKITSGTQTYGAPANTTTIPIGLVLGPALTIGNMSGAGSANSGFKSDLNTYNLTGRTIPAGQTIYGIIGVQSPHYNALFLKHNETPAAK